MHISLTIGSIAALFGIMIVGALVPSVSVLTVSARSATSGFIHGVFTTLGIVFGDIIFILTAIFGLSVLADSLGNLFVVVKYLGAAVLIWLGVTLWRSRSMPIAAEEPIDASLFSSFFVGLFITLGDQKAILFYFAFFPAFLDLSKITLLDTGIIVVMAVVAIGSAKLGYAYMADRASRFFNNSVAIGRINSAAGVIMIAVGVYLVASA